MDSARKNRHHFHILLLAILLLSAFHSPKTVSASFQEPFTSVRKTFPFDQPAVQGANLPEASSPDQNENASPTALQTSFTPLEISNPVLQSDQEPSSIPTLSTFRNRLLNGNADVIRGVYSPEGFALRVIQQPEGDPAYVAAIDGVATQFNQAAKMNITGLLAHNFSAGRYFSLLKPGSPITIIYGDGTTRNYSVDLILQYQAMEPNSPSTNLKDLNTGEILTAGQTFQKVYSGNHHLTLQTCITMDGLDTWGRMFIIAYPAEGPPDQSSN